MHLLRFVFFFSLVVVRSLYLVWQHFFFGASFLLFLLCLAENAHCRRSHQPHTHTLKTHVFGPEVRSELDARINSSANNFGSISHLCSVIMTWRQRHPLHARHRSKINAHTHTQKRRTSKQIQIASPILFCCVNQTSRHGHFTHR